MSLNQIANIRMGVGSLTYNGVNLGHTLDGIEIEVERNFQDLTVDKYGTTPVDLAVIGQRATIKCKFAEPVVELLLRINPEGLNQTGSAGTKAGFGTDSGVLLRQFSALLTIHPAEKAASVLDEDIVYYKAINTNNLNLNFKVDEQRVIEVEFVAVIDESQPSGRRLGHIGLTNIS